MLAAHVRRAGLATAGLLVVGLTGCGRSGPTTADIVGLWKVEPESVARVAVPARELDQAIDAEMKDAPPAARDLMKSLSALTKGLQGMLKDLAFDFRSDGTVEVGLARKEKLSMARKGRWTLAGDVVTVTMATEGDDPLGRDELPRTLTYRDGTLTAETTSKKFGDLVLRRR